MSEWKTQRYEGSVGVDGRWVVSRSEAESRIEAAERERDEAVAEAYARQDEVDYLKRERDNAVFYEGRTAAKLAAVREWIDHGGDIRGVLAILDGEGEK